jgi:penicillin-binding protein 1A
MNEVYRRKPSPPDWPMPISIVSRQIDVTTNMLSTPYCPASVVGKEFFIPGTDPMYPCDVHSPYGLHPDSMGVYAPGGAFPAPGAPRAMIDSGRGRGGVIPQIFMPVPQPSRQPARDSATTRNMDSLLSVIPKRDSTKGRGGRTIFTPRDSIVRRPKPDTTRVRPDTGCCRE